MGSLNRSVTKSKFFALVLMVNGLILAGGYYYFTRLYKATPAVVSAPATNDALAAALKAAERPPQVIISNAPPVVVYQTNQFNWRQVESSDYRTYIANLRGVGCPETTIKDIILTDIMKLFAERRGQFYQNGREFKFWETSEKRSLNARQLEEREKQLSKIDKELPSVLRELLGINYEREINKYFVDNHEDERRLGFVSEDKRSKLLALREDVEKLKEHLFDQAQNGQPIDPEQLKKIQEHRQQVLTQILTPEERVEYELRTSDTAERLRSQLVGFNPSEQEFRDIYNLWQTHDEKFALVSPDDANARKAKEQDQQRIDQEIKNKLAPDRVVEYERTRSQDYQKLCFFAERYELPAATVQALAEIKQIAENARQGLLSERTMAEGERQAGLKAIQEETQRAIRQNLGEKLYPAYARNAGNWMDALGTAAVSP
jgi:hypothetical protein